MGISSRPRWHDAHERGNQVVEFALLAPVLVFILMLAIDGGRLVMTYSTMKNAAREVALYAANNPNPSTSQLKTIALQEGGGALISAQLLDPTVDTTTQQLGNPPVTQVVKRVKLDYRFQFTNPVLGIGNPLTISTSAAAAVP